MEQEKKNQIQSAQNTSNISGQMIQISKTTDLLKAIPIINQLMKFGRDAVQVQISKYVTICAHGLDIPLDNMKLQMLVEDLTDKYKYDSIEDIQTCLKNGRRGDYGPTYGKFNMIVISEWMAKHLDMKSAARESANTKSKHEFKDREEYESFVNVGIKNQKEDADRIKKDKHDTAIKRAKHEEFRANYEKNKPKLSDGEGTIPPEK